MVHSPKFFKRIGRMTVLFDLIRLNDHSVLFKDSVGMSIKLGYFVVRIGTRRENFMKSGRLTVESNVFGDLFNIDLVIHTPRIQWRGVFCLGVDGWCEWRQPAGIKAGRC